MQIMCPIMKTLKKEYESWAVTLNMFPEVGAKYKEKVNILFYNYYLIYTESWVIRLS
jgi:hypothetical protein